MKEAIEKVVEFNETGRRPTITNSPTEKDEELVISLIKEEVAELHDAIISGNREECLDALCDILFTTFGAAYYLKLDNVLPEAFNRVCDANMSKFCTSLQEVKDSQDAYTEKGIETVFSVHKEKMIIMRKLDNKILKSILWKKEDFSDLIKI